MGDGACFTIDDVTRLTGVSRRTVRFYVTSKLIPPPDGRGVGLHYRQEHVDRVLRVVEAKRQGQTLAAIARGECRGPRDAGMGPDTQQHVDGARVHGTASAQGKTWAVLGPSPLTGAGVSITPSTLVAPATSAADADDPESLPCEAPTSRANLTLPPGVLPKGTPVKILSGRYRGYVGVIVLVQATVTRDGVHAFYTLTLAGPDGQLTRTSVTKRMQGSVWAAT